MRIRSGKYRIVIIVPLILFAIFLVGCGRGSNQTKTNEDLAVRHLDTTIRPSADGDQLIEMGLGSWVVLKSSLHASQGPVKILELVLLNPTDRLTNSVLVSAIGRVTSEVDQHPKRWLTKSLATESVLPSLTFQTGSFNVAFGIVFDETPPDGSFSLGIRYELPGHEPDIVPLEVTFQVADSRITVSTPRRYPAGRSGIGPRSIGGH